MVSHARAAEKQESRRIRSYKRALRLYQGNGALPGAYAATPDGQVISLNVIASIVRSLRAKIVKNRPRPWIVTDGGTQAQQDSAQALQQFVEGALYESDAYEAMEKAFDIAAICGEAWIKVYPDYDAKRVRVEVCYPWEILTDAQDAYYGSPRSVYQRSHIDREVLAEMFPEAESAIMTADSSKGDPDFQFRGDADQVEVWEGWRLASGSRVPGKHAIAIPSAALHVEDWKRERYPLLRFCIEPDPIGFHGTGVAEELGGIQDEINTIVAKIQEGHETGGHVMLLVESGSSVNKAKLTNQLHAIVEYTGTPPTPVVIPAVAPETYQWVWTLIDRAYQIYGISQMSAQAQKPAGLNSGRALRVFHDVESERFSYVARAYERLCVELAERIVDAATDLAEEFPDFTVRYRGPDSLKRIRWKDVDLDRDAYIMQVYPTSFLPQTPAGRLSAVQDMLDLRVVDPREARMLMDLPDLRGRPDPYEASHKLARHQIDAILREGQDVTPESFQDLALTLQLALDAYCRARTYSDVPAERLDLLREYIDILQEKLAPSPPPPPAPAPVDPATAMPMAPVDPNAPVPGAPPAM